MVEEPAGFENIEVIGRFPHLNDFGPRTVLIGCFE
jgi:hypothetical protein